MTFRGDPVGEFFSTAVRDSSRLLVCGVRPGPGEGETLLPTDVLPGPGDGDAPLPQVLFPVLEVLLLTRLLDDLPWAEVLTGENSSFPPRRPSPASSSGFCSFDFMLWDWLFPSQERLNASKVSDHVLASNQISMAGFSLSTYDCFDQNLAELRLVFSNH